MTCASPWACPVCACNVYASRAAEITKAIERWNETPGHAVSLLTLTVRHALGDDLREVRRVLTDAFRALWRGQSGGRLRRELGVTHFVRSLEVTHGANGWHPHLHVLLFQSRKPAADAVDKLKTRWRKIFEHQARRLRTRALGLTGELRAEAERAAATLEHATPSIEHGADLRLSRNARYIEKLGLEIASIATKRSQARTSLTPWEIAWRAADGDRRAQTIWTAYTEAMHGARQLTWSRGARAALGLSMSDEDERHAGEHHGELVASVPAAVWDRCSRVAGWTIELLRRARGERAGEECAVLIKAS
ncbi:MAG TPA: protein rep [Polyangiaceae bacterium]|nr:protein rep [Polyangiaceae bacterium]